MNYSSKLKQDFRIAGLIPAIVIVSAFFLAWILDKLNELKLSLTS